MDILLIIAFIVAILGAFSSFLRVEKNSSTSLKIRERKSSLISGVLFLLAGIIAIILVVLG